MTLVLAIAAGPPAARANSSHGDKCYDCERIRLLVDFLDRSTYPRGDPNSLLPQPGVLSPGRTFSEETGEKLYVNVCQGCHVADGKGAVGAGRYPSLANDDAVASGGYVAAVVVRGLRGMPACGPSMSDHQVAAMVNYVRTHFGNAEADPVTDADVAVSRR